MQLDNYLEGQIQVLEQFVRVYPDSPEARRAHTVLLRVQHCKHRVLLATAPRLRRHLLHDLRAATKALERLSGRDPPQDDRDRFEAKSVKSELHREGHKKADSGNEKRLTHEG